MISVIRSKCLQRTSPWGVYRAHLSERGRKSPEIDVWRSKCVDPGVSSDSTAQVPLSWREKVAVMEQLGQDSVHGRYSADSTWLSACVGDRTTAILGSAQYPGESWATIVEGG